MTAKTGKQRRSLERNARLVCARSFLYGGFGFLGPVIFSLWEEAQLGPVESATLETVFLIVLALGAIPGGVLADSLGRVLCLRLGGICHLVGMLVYCQAHSFGQFLAAEIVLAVGFCFCGGAESGLLRSSLEGLERGDQYNRLIGISRLYASCGFALSGLLGGMLGAVNLRLPILIGTAFIGVAGLLGFLQIEPLKAQHEVQRFSLGAMRMVVRECLVSNERVRWLMAFSAFLWTWQQTAAFFFQPTLRASGVSVAEIGMIFASLTLLSGVVAWKASWLHERLGERQAFAAIVFSGALGCICIALAPAMFAIVAISLLRIGMAYADVTLNSALKDEVASSITASVFSVQVCSARMMQAAVLPMAGSVVGGSGLFFMFFLLGVAVLTVGVMILRLHPQR